MEIRKERIDMNDKSNTQAMETEKIPRLLARLAIPAVVAQIINLLYNMLTVFILDTFRALVPQH